MTEIEVVTLYCDGHEQVTVFRSPGAERHYLTKVLSALLGKQYFFPVRVAHISAVVMRTRFWSVTSDTFGCQH